MNMNRRHLSTSQRAIIAAELSGDGAQGKRSDIGSNDPKLDRLEAATLLNVSEKSVKRAAALIAEYPELAEAIKTDAV